MTIDNANPAAGQIEDALIAELRDRLNAVIDDIAKRGPMDRESVCWEAVFIVGKAAHEASNGSEDATVKLWRRALEAIVDHEDIDAIA